MSSHMYSQPAQTQLPSFPDLLRGWRKARKISQGNLALDAGISQRHVSFLESGRSSPSRDMVMLLSLALSLPLREQNTLLNAAGFASIFPHRKLEQEDLNQARHVLSLLLESHEPYPAIVVDRNWNLLMSNRANNRVFSMFIDPVTVWETIAPGKPPNLLRLALHPQGMQHNVQNFKQLATYFIEQLTQELNTNPYNSEARSLLEEIADYPGMPIENSFPDCVKPLIEVNLNKGDIHLSFLTMISTFGIPRDVTLQEIRIETFFPADEETERMLKSAD